MTAEDPVEFYIPGINQVNIRDEIDLNFAAALRAFLRQDPDIMLVGEMRDQETVDIAIKAALTGHLVFSTIHTNDAASTVHRLMNMNVEPFLIADSLFLIVAQRLVREVCRKCAVPHKASRAPSSTWASPRRAEGVPPCRAGAASLQQHRLQGPDRPVRGHGDRRRHPGADPPRGQSKEIKRKAMEQGMITLRRSGYQDQSRHHHLEEVLRETVRDE